MMDDRIAEAAIRLLWKEYHITYRPIVSIVAVMAMDEARSLEDALQWWADFEAIGKSFTWPASRWRSNICYRLLKVGQDAPGGLELWFKARAKEVRDIANRVHS